MRDAIISPAAKFEGALPDLTAGGNPPPGFVVDGSGAKVEPVIAGLAGRIAHSGTTFSTLAVAPLPKDEEILTIGDQVLA